MSRRPRVLLDVDGVLADFIGGALAIINRLFDTKHVHADITEFDIAASLGLDAHQSSMMKHAIGSTSRLAAGLSVFPGAVDGVLRLREIADVYVVTSSWDSNETWEYDRKAWLRRHFDIGHHNIVFTAAKHLVLGDVLVDDKTSTLDVWREAHPAGVAVQWSTPHNRRDLWDGPSTSDWSFLVDEIVARLPNSR